MGHETGHENPLTPSYRAVEIEGRDSEAIRAAIEERRRQRLEGEPDDTSLTDAEWLERAVVILGRLPKPKSTLEFEEDAASTRILRLLQKSKDVNEPEWLPLTRRKWTSSEKFARKHFGWEKADEGRKVKRYENRAERVKQAGGKYSFDNKDGGRVSVGASAADPAQSQHLEEIDGDLVELDEIIKVLQTLLTDRQLEIFRMQSEPDKPTQEEIAGKLGVSVKTVQRDIDKARATLEERGLTPRMLQADPDEAWRRAKGGQWG